MSLRGIELELAVSEDQKKDFLAAANLALAEADPQAADSLYNELVTAVSRVFGDNQKDIAAELARLARSIEESGRQDDAMRLKQRTCEALLKMSMAARHRSPPKDGVPVRSQAPVSSETAAGSGQQFAFLLVLCESPDDFARRAGEHLKGIEFNSGLARLKGVEVIVHRGRAGGFVPVFAISGPLPSGCEIVNVRGVDVGLVHVQDKTRIGFVTTSGRMKLTSR